MFPWLDVYSKERDLHLVRVHCHCIIERARVDKPIQASSAQFAVSTHLEIFAS